MESGKNERDGELNRREFNELEYERGELSGLNWGGRGEFNGIRKRWAQWTRLRRKSSIQRVQRD